MEEIIVKVEYQEPGRPGLNGQDGLDGDDGMDGEDGSDGNDGSNGWTPKYTDEVYGDKIIKKLSDYISGTGSKPTENIGLYLSNSGFTANKDLAINYKGAMPQISFTIEQGNLIATII